MSNIRVVAQMQKVRTLTEIISEAEEILSSSSPEKNKVSTTLSNCV